MNLLGGLIQPYLLASLEPKDIASEQKKLEREKANKDGLEAGRSDFNAEILKNSTKGKGFFTCKKCKGQNTTYYQMQTRGADEPMTNFVTCLDCKNQWKC